MCGIAGWVDFYRHLDCRTKVLEAMSNTLICRGPDADGMYFSPSSEEDGCHACLIHRRLIVIDPENGEQPMRAQDAARHSYVIVYNGELYNTPIIQKELSECGWTFQGHCDTEVLLKAYIQWGEACLEKLNGIYAFAIWEEQEQKLFCARDRMGVKPFFFYPYAGGLLFGSRIKTLLAHPMVKPEIDKEGLKELFLLGPAKTPGSGIFRGIRELKPAQCLTMSKEYGLQISTYWKLQAHEHSDTLEQTIEKTRFLLEDAIRGQLVSDVPLCCFLSGGLDSSVISALAAKHNREVGAPPLDTYSVDYVDNAKYFTKSIFQPNSDNEYIKMMVEAIGSVHHEVVLSNEDVAAALTDAVLARDVPGMADIDSSLLLFCREVKKNFTVAVSGECADEVFGGYPWYHNPDILFEECFPWSRTTKLRERLLKDGVLDHCEEYLQERYRQTVSETDTLPSDSKLDRRMREMCRLNLDWFMQTLLTRKDTCSMYSGLEVRVPFCDHRLVEYAYNMPWSMKAYQGREKGIVRQAVQDLLPDEVVWRKKSPYPKTHNPLYTRLVSEGALKILADKNSIVSGLIDHDFVLELIQNPNSLTEPWYGQLMRGPQVLAYLIQLDFWFKENNVQIADF